MDLRLAVAECCTETGCQVAWLDGGESFAADYAALMVSYNVRIEPGQLVVVSLSTTPPQMVYRVDAIEVAWESGRPTLLRDGNPVDAGDVAAECFPIVRELYARIEAPKGTNWIDVSSLSFNALLLLERVQLSWLPGWLPESELAVALRANPAVAWFMRHKCPELAGWLDDVMAMEASAAPGPDEVRQAELAILQTLNDLLTYALNPAAYDAQPFLRWDDQELLSLIDFAGKTVIDIGSGTGRLAFVAAREGAKAVYAVEPVANLRDYIRARAGELGLANVYAVDGLITDLPFSGDFADVTVGGHVFGDHREEELVELLRVTRPGGMVILCPANADKDNDRHSFLGDHGFAWSRFEEPGEGTMRKYWRVA